MGNRNRFVVGLAALISSVALLSGTAAAAPVEGVPNFGHVFLIVGENTEIGQVNKQVAPYLTSTIKPSSAWLTNYFAVTHFSEANYSAMTSGLFTDCQQFDGSIASCHQNFENIFHQLDGQGISWQSWLESMPAPCYSVSAGSAKDLNHYGAKHNPAIFYDNIEGAGGVWSNTTPSTECLNNDLPMGGTGPNDTSTFDARIATGDVARMDFIVPNECEDGHDNCKPQGNGVSQFDAFLQREVPAIMHSPAFGSDGVLIITFDEGTSNQGPASSKQFAGGGNVVFAVLGQHVRPGVYGGSYNHYSLLRTLEDGFGITSYAGNANSASPISTIWQP